MNLGMNRKNSNNGNKVIQGVLLLALAIILPTLLVIWAIVYLANSLLFCIPLFTNECAAPGEGYYKQPYEDEKLVDLSLSMVKMRNDFETVESGDYMHLKPTYMGYVGQYMNDYIPGLNLSSAERFTMPEEEAEKEEEPLEETVVYKETDDVYKITDATSYDKSKLIERVQKNVAPDEKTGYTNIFREPEYKDVVDWIIEAAAAEEFGNGIDPVFMISVMLHETGNGRARLIWEDNNPGGIKNITATNKELFRAKYGIEIMDGPTFAIFNSLKEGIQYKAWLFKKHYADEGYLTLAEFKPKYAPNNDEIDVNNLNDNWSINVGYFLKGFGVDNVGDFGIPNQVNTNVARPDFDRFEFQKEILYKGRYYNVLEFLKHVEEYRTNIMEVFETTNENYHFLHDKFVKLSEEDKEYVLKEIGVEELSYKEAEKKYLKYGTDEKSGNEGPYFTDVHLPEAELHLRTSLQFDNRGFDGDNSIWVEYETGYALNRIYRMLENKYNEDEDFYVDNKDGVMDADRFKEEKDYFYEILRDEGIFKYPEYFDLSEKQAVEEILTKNSSNRNAIYRLAADHNALYPFIAKGIGRIPENYSNELELEIMSARDEYVDKLDAKLLSAVSIGHFYKEYSIIKFEEYVDKKFEDDPFIFGGKYIRGRYVEKFRTHVREQYDKVLTERETGEFNPEDTVETGETTEETIDNATDAVKKNWKRNLIDAISWVGDELFTIPERRKREYIDNAINESEFIRFAMYRDTHEMAEIGGYVKNLCFYGVYHDIELKEYLIDEDYPYEDNKDSFANYDSEICRYANAYSVEGAYMDWEHTDVLDKAKSTSNVFYERISLIPQEEAKLSQLEYEYENIEGRLTEEEYENLLARIDVKSKEIEDLEEKKKKREEWDNLTGEELKALVDKFNGKIKKLKEDFEEEKSIGVTIDKIAELENEKKELTKWSNATEEGKKSWYENIDKNVELLQEGLEWENENKKVADEAEEEARKKQEEIDAQKELIESMKEREKELLEIRATTIQDALQAANGIGTKCFGSSCSVPIKSLFDDDDFDAKKFRDEETPPKPMDLYTEWHVGIKDVSEQLVKLDDDKLDDGEMEEVYSKLRKKYTEAILNYETYMTSGELSKIESLAKKINMVNSEYKATLSKMSGKEFSEDDYAKAMLIYMPNNFDVAIHNDEGIVVGLIKKAANSQIIKGTMDIEYVDIENNQKRLVKMSEPLRANKEEPVVEKIEMNYFYDYNAYYETVFDAYMENVETSLKTRGYEKANDVINVKEEFKEDSLDKFEVMTGVDYVNESKFVKQFRDWLSTKTKKGSKSFSVLGGTEYANSEGQNPKYDPIYFQGLEFGLPIETNGEKMRITSLRGPRWGRLHAGIDAGRHEWKRTNIIAVADGVVEFVERRSDGYGYNVIIRHDGPNGVFYTRYAHMVAGSIEVSEGEPIFKGDVIGVMGETGSSTAIHLHFNVYQGALGKSNTVDPIAALGYNDTVVKCSYRQDECMERYGWK